MESHSQESGVGWVWWAEKTLETNLGTDWLQGNRVIEGKCFLLLRDKGPRGWALAATSGILFPSCGSVEQC